MMMSLDKLFTQQQRQQFDNCCQYYELALSHFGYNVQAQCYVNDKKRVVLYAVNVFYQGQQHQAFTALTLDEFYRKMELIYQIYLHAKEQQCTLDEALDHFLSQYQQYIAIQGELDDMLNWHDYVDEELGRSNYYSFDTLVSNSRTLH